MAADVCQGRQPERRETTVRKKAVSTETTNLTKTPRDQLPVYNKAKDAELLMSPVIC